MTSLFGKFLDAAAALAVKELQTAGTLSDQAKHHAAHDHLVRYSTIQDVLKLGQEMLDREMKREMKKIREGARA
jgi:hypothetical protein